MSKFLSFIVFLSFADISFAASGCATGTSGSMTGVVICAVDDGKSLVEQASGGLILIASVMAGVFLVIRLLKN